MSKLGRLSSLKAIVIIFFLINIFVGQVNAAELDDNSINVIQQEENKTQKDENLIKFILFITIDGLGEESVAKGYTPNMNGLAGSGVKTKAISVFPTETAPALASILTGAYPEEHKYTKSGDTSKVTSLSDLIAMQKQSVMIIDGKNGISKGLSPKAKILTDNKGDKSTTDLAIKQFEAKKPYYMHVILSGVDQANKKYGPQSKEHFTAVEEADKQVGRLLGKLHEYGLYQYSVVVISGTYGVENKAHEKKYTNNNEVMVPLYIKGPTIEAGKTIPVANITNIAPTVSYILGMKTTKQDSQVLWDILKNEGGSSEAYLLKKRVRDLGEALNDSARREYGLEYEKLAMNEEKNTLKQERGKVQSIIDGKDKEIKKRDFKIGFYKFIGLAALIIFIAGYILEYSFLRKKFLMFK